MEASFLVSTEEALEHFHVDETQGLSEEQVKKALETYGPNGTVHHHISNLRQAVLTAFLNSAARRSSYAAMEACP